MHISNILEKIVKKLISHYSGSSFLRRRWSFPYHRLECMLNKEWSLLFKASAYFDLYLKKSFILKISDLFDFTNTFDVTQFYNF